MPDHRPILGGISGLDGFYLATGSSGHGFMLAPAVGEIMVSLSRRIDERPVIAGILTAAIHCQHCSEGLQI